MELLRIKDPGGVRFRRSMQHYKTSFPSHEQREAASQLAILSDADYHFCILLDGGADENEVGSILYWETRDFVYVEHFYIYPEVRGKGYGGKALHALRPLGKPVILEIDPPVDEVSIRRKEFYVQNGFVVNPYPHIHPPYHPKTAGHNLVLLSWPEKLTPAECGRFQRYLQEHVMAGAFS